MKLKQLWQRHIFNLLYAWGIIALLFRPGWIPFITGVLIWIPLFYFTAPGVYWSCIYEFSPPAKRGLTLLEKAVSLNPLVSGPYQRLGVLYAHEKNWDKAIIMLKKALEFSTPRTAPSIQAVLAAAYREGGMYEEALQLLHSLIEKGDRSAHTYINLAQTCIKLDKLDESLAAANKARSFDTSSLAPVLLIGRIHFMMKDFQAAKDDYEWAIDHASWPEESYYWIGRSELELGEIEKAIEHLQIAVERITNDPDLSDVPVEEAKEWLEKAASLKPTEPVSAAD